MNKIDKESHRALRFLSRLSVAETLKLKEKDIRKYRKYVSENLERTLEKIQYIILKGNFDNVVTQTGLQQLRDLEEIRRKDLTLIASTIAIVISIIALAKSMGWL